MTLKEKFWEIIKKPQTDRPNECEQIANEYAIEFAQWVKFHSELWMKYKTSELLEIFKKEREL